MKLIDKIRIRLKYLPPKDCDLCNKLLDKRQFVELKEIIDSDVYKLSKALDKTTPKKENDLFSAKYENLEKRFNILKELQRMVNEQASAFEDTSDFCFNIDDEL